MRKKGDIDMLEKQKTMRSNMSEGPLLSKMIMFALPLMATGLLQVLYNASDMIIVGNFSDAGSFAVGAVGACGALINLIVNAFMGLAIGAGIITAQSVGAHRHDEVSKIVHTALFSSVICGIAVGVFGFIACKPLLMLMNIPDELLGEATLYMKAYFVGVPAMMVYNFLAATLRSSGDSKRPLIFLSISGIMNVGLNIVMVLGFGMGAMGVGIATSFAQYASAIMILVYMVRYDGVCKISLKDVRIHKDKLFGIIKNGVPASIQSVVFSLSNVLIQSTINSYGPIVVSGNAAAGNIEGFVYVAMNALYQTTMTFTGQNVGAGKIKRVRRIVVLSVIMVSIVGLALGGLCVIFGEPLLSIYEPGSSAEQEAIRQAGILRLRIVGTLYFLCGIMEILSGTMRGMGKSLLPMGVSIVGTCVFRIAWIYTVCPIAPTNITLLLLAYPVTWFITIVGHLCCLVFAYRRMARTRSVSFA